MTPTEIYEEARKLASEIGDKALVCTGINNNHPSHAVITGTVYADGIVGDLTILERAQTYEDLFAQIRAKWLEHADRHREQAVENIALEIIRLTALHGECTDAALRGSGFDAADVSRYGHDACTRADEMAKNGPFSITRLAGANAAS